jgi:hypothetical protein
MTRLISWALRVALAAGLVCLWLLSFPIGTGAAEWYKHHRVFPRFFPGVAHQWLF